MRTKTLRLWEDVTIGNLLQAMERPLDWASGKLSEMIKAAEMLTALGH